MTFVSFMSSAAGRVLRVIVGLGLIGWGAYLAVAAGNSTTGIILAVVGLLPLVAGLLDFCVFAPLFGAPFSGAKVRVHDSDQTAIMSRWCFWAGKLREVWKKRRWDKETGKMDVQRGAVHQGRGLIGSTNF